MTQDLKNQLVLDLKKMEEWKGKELQEKVVQLLDEKVDYYNWTGFYFMNDEKQQLEIGPYVGEKTDHTTIPYGRGICGQVALSGQTFEVPDVHAQNNYLACSIATKSEIVVPIFKKDKLVGQLDIDSHVADPFTSEDHEVLELACEMIAAGL